MYSNISPLDYWLLPDNTSSKKDILNLDFEKAEQKIIAEQITMGKPVNFDATPSFAERIDFYTVHTSSEEKR